MQQKDFFYNLNLKPLIYVKINIFREQNIAGVAKAKVTLNLTSKVGIFTLGYNIWSINYKSWGTSNKLKTSSKSQPRLDLIADEWLSKNWRFYLLEEVLTKLANWLKIKTTTTDDNFMPMASLASTKNFIDEKETARSVRKEWVRVDVNLIRNYGKDNSRPGVAKPFCSRANFQKINCTSKNGFVFYHFKPKITQRKVFLLHNFVPKEGTVCFTDLDQGSEILSKFSLPKSMKHCRARATKKF
jgi:hypothetical protein